MKRIPVLICALLTLALSACGGDSPVCPNPPCSANGGLDTAAASK